MDGAIKHPDFIITVNGRDVTRDCTAWAIQDSEESMGSLTATLDNRDNRYSGKISNGDTLAIRFGHFGRLSEKVEMRILKRREHYGKSGLTLVLTCLDATQKLTGKTARGHQEGTKVKENLDQIGKEAGVEIDHSKLKDQGEKGKTKDCRRTPVLGGTPLDEHMQSLLDDAEGSEGAQEGSGKTFDASAPEGGKSSGNLSDNRAVAPDVAAGDKTEQNRLNNASKRAKSEGIKGKLQLVGYPLLKAKMCVTILGVGPEASGKWYVKNSHQSWSKGGGYRTSADLLRGGTGKGQNCAPQPNVFYANIYKKDNIYAGPRQVDSESQATFVFGDGTYVEDFTWEEDSQTGRGGGKKVEGKTVNRVKASDPIENVESKDSGGGGQTEDTPTLGSAPKQV